MNKTRRKLIISAVTIPVVGAGGCGSGGSDTHPAVAPEASAEPVACDEITPFTPLTDVEACGSLIDPESDRARVLGYQELSPVEGESCASCVFYRGAAGSVSGICSLLSGGLVPSVAWCTSYRKG